MITVIYDISFDMSYEKPDTEEEKFIMAIGMETKLQMFMHSIWLIHMQHQCLQLLV